MATNPNRMLNLATALSGKKDFVIERLSGREELSRLFEYQLELVSEKEDITPDELLGTNATVRVELPGAKGERFFNGYITRFGVHGKVKTPAFTTGEGFKYTATLSPWLWFLTRSATCHVSVEKTFQEVIETVFGRWGELKKVKMDLQGQTEKREHLVQYRETDFNYFSRLAEQAGLYYYFTHKNGEHELVLTNDVGKHKAATNLAELKYSIEQRDEDTVSSFDHSTEVQSGQYAVDDFDPIKPKAALVKVQTKARTHKNAGFEIYDYPGEYADATWGDNYAKYRVEELNCRHEMYRGVTTNRTVQVGHKVKLSGHPLAANNKDYLVVSHSFSAVNNHPASGAGHGARFSAEFTTIPAATQFRAARVTPKPSIAGPQTAFVVGPAGEEIHTDKYGRVKLQFHWDRLAKGTDENQCWVRVSQALAGKGWGGVNLPRVGQEVVVEFLEGDPDRPLVTGRLYNADQMPPYALPDEKARTGIITRTYKGGNDDFNELRFDDKKGEEQVYLQAQRNLDLRVKKDYAASVDGKVHQTIKEDVFEKLKAAYHLDLTGDHSNKVGGSLSFNVTQDTHLKAAKVLADAQQEVHLKGGMKVIVEAGTQLSLKVGGNFIDINPGGVFIKGTMVMINSGGSAGSGSGASPIAPKAPTEAIKSKGGAKDEPPKARPAPKPYGAQASSFKTAAATGAPFCEACAAAANC